MELTSFISYLIFSIYFILGRIMENINVSDNEQKVTKHIGQQHDNASSKVIQ